MNDPLLIRRLSPQEFSALLERAKACAAAVRVEVYAVVWAGLAARACRLVRRLRETKTAVGSSSIAAPHIVDFR